MCIGAAHIFASLSCLTNLTFCDAALLRVAWYQACHCKYPCHWAPGLWCSVVFLKCICYFLSINNFLAQALVEFFGTLSREWALECMKDLLLVNLRGNLQIVVQVILLCSCKHFLFHPTAFPPLFQVYNFHQTCGTSVGCERILWTIRSWCLHKIIWAIQILWGPLLFLGILSELQVVTHDVDIFLMCHTSISNF